MIIKPRRKKMLQVIFQEKHLINESSPRPTIIVNNKPIKPNAKNNDTKKAKTEEKEEEND